MASSELRVFTREELAKYDGGRSALRKARETGEPLDRSQVYSTYISIHGMVYDVTQFLGRHPGGPDEILRYAGKECTAEFENIGHSSRAFAMMRDYLVGRLADSKDSNSETQ